MSQRSSRIHTGQLYAIAIAMLPLLLAMPVGAVQTNDLELGLGSVYDDQLHIQRNAAGQMTFQDTDITTPVALTDLAGGVSAHGELTGLTGDDHTQYLNDSRHGTAHTSTFNSALAIPSDVDGNTSLGDHVADSDIHLQRDETVEVTGDWRFSGTPALWSGTAFSNSGAEGDVAVTFEDGDTDAQILWDDSESAFAVNRGISVTGNLDASGNSHVEGNLTVDGYLLATHAYVQDQSEYMHLKMNDNANDATVTDDTGRFSQALSDATGDPNTSAHSVTGVIGNALSFDGSDDIIDCGTTLMNDVLTTGHDFSVAQWIYIDSAQTMTRNPFAKGAGSPSAVYIQSRGVATILRSVVWVNGTMKYSDVNPSPTNTWLHITIVREATTIRMYHNANEIYSNTATGNDADISNGSNLHLMSGLNGRLDDLRIYGRALSLGEIGALYNAGSGTESSVQVVTSIDGAASLDLLGVDGGITTGVLQVSDGAYCDGNSWVDVSTRRAKTDILLADPTSEWQILDQIEVVEFAYRRRNPSRGGWLNPQEQPVPTDSDIHRRLTHPGPSSALEALVSEGYHRDTRRYLAEPLPRRQLGFIAEDLYNVSPRLSRKHGIAPLDIAAFNTAVLKETKRRLLDAEQRSLELTAALDDLEARMQSLEDPVGP